MIGEASRKDTMQNMIIDLLKTVQRDGMDQLIDYLIVNKFFDAPASTRYHGCYDGGLAEHSFNVFRLLSELNTAYNLQCSQDSMIIAALLHDVCKVGAYIKSQVIGSKAPYYWNKSQPKGHAALSIYRIEEFIELSELEKKMIQYHMGVYGLKEFDGKGEYTLREKGLANAWHHHPIVKVMYFCDELATLQEKAKENL